MPFSISGSGDITVDVTEAISAEEDQATADAKFESDRVAAEASVSGVEAAIVDDLKAIVAKYPGNFKSLMFAGQSQSTDLVIVVQSEANPAPADPAPADPSAPPVPDVPADPAPTDAPPVIPVPADSSVVTTPDAPPAA